jgi:hypothetical protein
MDWTARVITALDALPGDRPWEVIPGAFTPPMPVCGSYPTAGAAHSALIAAGFRPTGKAIASPPLAPHYDLQTVVRSTAGEGLDVILVRRMAR